MKITLLIITLASFMVSSCAPAIKATGYIPIAGLLANGMRNDVLKKEREQKRENISREFLAQYPNWNKLQEGMTKSRVQTLLGRPAELFQGKRYTYIHKGTRKRVHFNKDTGKVIGFDSV